MTSPSSQGVPNEPHEGIDASSTKEAKTFEAENTPPLARSAGGEGPPPTDAPLTGEAPVVEGAGAGDPLAGVRATDEDIEHAVEGDS